MDKQKALNTLSSAFNTAASRTGIALKNFFNPPREEDYSARNIAAIGVTGLAFTAAFAFSPALAIVGGLAAAGYGGYKLSKVTPKGPQ